MVVVVTTLAVAGWLASALEAHVPEAAGPEYWRWPFRTLGWSALRWAFLPVLALAALAHRARGARTGAALALITVAFVWVELAIAGATDGDYSLRRLERIVASSQATSYWTAAQTLLRDPAEAWLGEWASRMRDWPLHARNKPPGPVLVYVVMHALAEDRGAFLGAIVVAALAACCIPAAYAFARSLGGTRDAALETALVAALAPGLALITPELDQLYPMFTIAAAASWTCALRRGSPVAAMLTGVAMAAATFFAFHLAALGLPLAALGAARAVRTRRVAPVVGLAVVAVVTFVVVHAAVRIRTGYDALAVLEQGLADRATMSAYHARVGPESRLYDLTDFALGLGWPTAIVVLAAITHTRVPRETRAVATSGLLLAGTLAALRLLPTETARTWMFLQPLLWPAAGAYLARASAAERLVVRGMALVLLVAIARNLVFIAV